MQDLFFFSIIIIILLSSHLGRTNLKKKSFQLEKLNVFAWIDDVHLHYSKFSSIIVIENVSVETCFVDFNYLILLKPDIWTMQFKC